MSKAAIIGTYENICIYKLIGFETIEVKSASEAENAIKRLENQDTAIIFVAEEFIKELDLKYDNSKIFVISIPFSHTEKSFGMESVRKKVIAATGSDIIFGKD